MFQLIGFITLAFNLANAEPYTCESKLTNYINSVNQIALDQFSTQGLTPEEIYTQKLYLRVAGTTAVANHPRFRRAVSFVTQKKFFDAAQTIAQDTQFLQVRAKNFVAPYTSKDYSTIEPFNDMQALMIGVIRDEKDSRLILTGDIAYRGYSILGLPAVAENNNNHYAVFEDQRRSFQSDLEFVPKQKTDANFQGMGALTTRAWGQINYNMGTNRVAVENTILHFLCVPKETWKTRGVPDHFVRRDVPRDPSGDPSIFQNHCRSCHGILDAMGGAFARLDFVDNQIVLDMNKVQAKMNQKSEFYPQGYVTVDESWMNYLPYNKAIDFGWRTPMKGESLKDFATMVSNSFAYSQCFVKKVYQEVCGQSILDLAPDRLNPIAQDFEANGYNLKRLFARVGAESSCLAYPN